MNTLEVRWRIERMAMLLRTESRMDAYLTVCAEAHNQPWLHDPRPAPAPIIGGTIHDGPLD